MGKEKVVAALAQQSDPNDYSARFNTQLSPSEESTYQAWAAANNRTKDVYDYDMRGAWRELQSGSMQVGSDGHIGDKYKKPNHPTFSQESQYSRAGRQGGRWKDSGARTADGEPIFDFEPAPQNAKNMGPKSLNEYFSKYEKGKVLGVLGKSNADPSK